MTGPIPCSPLTPVVMPSSPVFVDVTKPTIPTFTNSANPTSDYFCDITGLCSTPGMMIPGCIIPGVDCLGSCG